jgi:DNA-binding MarR family transcriptional regulator
MKHLPRDVIATKAQQIGMVLDHLVAALGGDPSSTMRRAVVLADIDENPGTTQSAIMSRMTGVHKSALTRDIEWLYDHGCVTRNPSPSDAREIELRICGYAKRNLDLALNYFNNSHKSLKNFLEAYISMFGDYKPTLRDAKIISVVGDRKDATKQHVLDGLYHGAATTENRALGNLVDLGFLDKD